MVELIRFLFRFAMSFGLVCVCVLVCARREWRFQFEISFAMINVVVSQPWQCQSNARSTRTLQHTSWYFIFWRDKIFNNDNNREQRTEYFYTESNVENH